MAPHEIRNSALGVLAALFFMWGFCTVLNDILVPYLKAVFGMTYVEAMLVQAVFFASYLVISVPSARLVERAGYKASFVIGVLVMALGCLMFLPAASAPSYPLFLVALFVMASGITLLQVGANPYVAVIGGEKTSSARLNLVQGFNSFATTVGPWYAALFILSRTNVGGPALGGVVPLGDRLADARAVQAPYAVIALLLAILVIAVLLTRLPHVAAPARAEANDTLWKHKALVMGAVAIFVYVGAEVSIGSLLISYATSEHVGHMTMADAAWYVGFYWGGAMLGRFLIGAVMLRFVAPSKMLADNCLGAVFLVVLSIAAHGPLALWAIILVGVCNSIMFPTIFSLAIRGLGGLTGRGSGILVMAIFGGAVVPMLQAALADAFGITISFIVPMACYAYIWLFALRSLGEDPAPRRVS